MGNEKFRKLEFYMSIMFDNRKPTFLSDGMKVKCDRADINLNRNWYNLFSTIIMRVCQNSQSTLLTRLPVSLSV